MRGATELLFVLAVACTSTTGMPGSIGVVARREAATGRVVVTDVPDGGAGARAGLEVGDEILTVDGIPVIKLSPEEFHRAVRGESGSKVVLDVLRNGVVQRVVVERMPMREKKP